MLKCWKRWCAAAVAALAICSTAGTAAAAAATPSAPAVQPAPLLDAVAKRLGLPTSKLEAAIRAAELERWNAFADAHHVPADKAKQIQQRIQSDPLRLVARFGAHGRRDRAGGVLNAAAGYLGLSPAQLAGELRKGQSLAEVAAARGRSTSGLKEALYSTAEAELGRRVEAGELSAEQRDEALAQLKAHLDTLINHRPRGSRGTVSLRAA